MSIVRTIRIGGNFTQAQLSANPFQGTSGPLVLKLGQLAIESDTLRGKRGDGVTPYSTLGYVFENTGTTTLVTDTQTGVKTITVPKGYSKYRINVYLPDGSIDNSRININGTTASQVKINYNGDTLSYVFF